MIPLEVNEINIFISNEPMYDCYYPCSDMSREPLTG